MFNTNYQKPSDYFLPLLLGVTFILSCLIIFLKFDTKTAGWKTYHNEKLGFEIQYPKDYVYVPCNSNCVGDIIQDADYFNMTVSRVGYLPKDTDFNTWADQVVKDSYSQSVLLNQKKTMLNKYFVRKIDHSAANYLVDYYLSDAKSVVKIEVSVNSINSDAKKTIDRILSTFKFKDLTCKKGESLKECKLGPCCCPVGAMCD